jgi:predicted metalloendopeptidase
MSYKDELKKQIEQLEQQTDSNKLRLQQLYRELADVQLKERTGDQPVKVELLQG